ncbi:HEPN domain-containing protein [Breznakibacter xylanolyticus]|uniref:HEPN domain-containing protein n=1 Tax=Breznakibacter xylanolyticus TaxID=990 RepID=A0A2W7PR85_9BACT|nr:HEPN domain-containing protein [Breznakibacter xylanolyticus]PZX11919.1 HEPN domain-containing protein [Breznakibacter xylanolyticus]
MKPTTLEWLSLAEDDLLAAKSLVSNERLTNIAAFHCQQCIEKCLKALLEEKELGTVKSHDLIRLLKLTGLTMNGDDMELLVIINEVYIDARYPGEMGLLPHGKPTPNDINLFVLFCEKIIHWINNLVSLMNH